MKIRSVSPQFLVRDLPAALDFYQQRLGFRTDFVYQDFYASVSRNGAAIHLKCAPTADGERAHRRANDHLDAFFDVTDARALHRELEDRQAPITQPLTRHPWAALDFQVTDPDGYILCFSEDLAEDDGDG